MIGRAGCAGRKDGQGGVGLDEIQQGRGEFAIGAAQVRHDGGVIVSRHLDDARHPPGGGHARRVLQRVEIQVGIFVFRHGDHEGTVMASACAMGAWRRCCAGSAP